MQLGVTLCWVPANGTKGKWWATSRNLSPFGFSHLLLGFGELWPQVGCWDLRQKEPGSLNDRVVGSCLPKRNTFIPNSSQYKLEINFCYVQVLKCWCLSVTAPFLLLSSNQLIPNQYIPRKDILLNNTLVSISTYGYRKRFTYEEKLNQQIYLQNAYGGWEFMTVLSVWVQQHVFSVMYLRSFVLIFVPSFFPPSFLPFSLLSAFCVLPAVLHGIQKGENK